MNLPLRHGPSGPLVEGTLVIVTNTPLPGYIPEYQADGTWLAVPSDQVLPVVTEFLDNETVEVPLAPAATTSAVRVFAGLTVGATATSAYDVVGASNGAGDIGDSVSETFGATPVGTVDVSLAIVAGVIVLRCVGTGPGDPAKLTSRVGAAFAR